MKQTTLEAWVEWRERCALALCEEETRRVLTEWGASIFRNAVRKLNPEHEFAREVELKGGRVDPAWSWMEVHLVAGRKSEGKRYKDHLFDCAYFELTAEDKRIALERYFATTCKHEAHRLLTRAKSEKTEGQRAREEGVLLHSLSEPVRPEPDSPTFAEVYQGAQHEELTPDSAAAQKELEIIARREADVWLPLLTLRQKLVLGCLADARSLADPAVCIEAGCGKSQLYEEQAKVKATLQNFKESLEAKYSSENDAEAVIELSHLAIAELARICKEFLPPENPGTT